MAQKFLSDIHPTAGLKDSSGDLGSDGQVLSSTGTGTNWVNQEDGATVIYDDQFTATAGQTAFTLSNTVDAENKTQVYIDGAYQAKAGYTVSGNTLTFDTGLDVGSEVEVITFATALANNAAAVIRLDEFTGNNSTTDFTLAQGVADEKVTQVYINGVYQHKDTYSITDVTLAFSTAPPTSADIEVITFDTLSSSGEIQASSTALYVKNTSGSTIAKGIPVYITGSVGNSNTLTVSPANASNASHMPATGLLLTTLANNSFGYIITNGFLKGLTTDTIDSTSTSSNDTIYVKAGGGLTMTKPTGTNLIQNIGKVARSSGGDSGSILVSSILRSNDVPNIASGKIWVGDSNAVATERSLSGDATLSNTGVLTLNNSSTALDLKANIAGPTFTGTPAAPTASAGTNTTQLATTAFVTTGIANIVDSSPAALNTLNELAAALGDDANFSTTVTNSIATKLPLAGGTLTGALGGTSATFSGSVTADQGIFDSTANTYAGGSLILRDLNGANPMYLTSVVGSLAISNGGSADHLLISSGGDVNIGTADGLPLMHGSVAANASYCTYSFVNDPDTGMIRTGANTLALITAGSPRLTIASNGLVTLDSSIVLDDNEGLFWGATSGSNEYIVNNGSDLILGTAGSPRLTISSGGDATFSGRVIASNDAAGIPTISAVNANTADDAGVSNLVFEGNKLRLGVSPNDSSYGCIASSGANSGLTFVTHDGLWTERMRISSGGTVQIYGTASANSLNIDHSSSNDVLFSIPFQSVNQDFIIRNSSAGVNLDYAATSWVSASDENIKENITSLDNVLDKIKNIRCVNYNLKDEEIYKKRLGFIAQDFQENFEEVTSIDNNDVLGLRYTETIPILLKAIQEQQTIIEDLKSRIETLEG